MQLKSLSKVQTLKVFPMEAKAIMACLLQLNSK